MALLSKPFMRAHFTWNLGRRSLQLGERTLVMGIVNVTPDSFSDGGQFASSQQAIDHALRLLDDGADILDIGGESTRPGSTVGSVSADEELHRVLPVIEGVKSARPEAIISIDTYKSATARAAVNAGAEIVNDVSGLRWDETMVKTIADLRCGCVLMHMRGTPDTWRTLEPLRDPVELVSRELRGISDHALKTGITRECIVLDPGFGFGKSFDENYPLLAQLDSLHALGFPLLSGTSRKSFLGRTAGARLGHDLPPGERLSATIASVTASVLKGAHIVRVHDVKPIVEAVAIADAILRATKTSE
jgi:dihydropteroate synthase